MQAELLFVVLDNKRSSRWNVWHSTVVLVGSDWSDCCYAPRGTFIGRLRALPWETCKAPESRSVLIVKMVMLCCSTALWSHLAKSLFPSFSPGSGPKETVRIWAVAPRLSSNSSAPSTRLVLNLHRCTNALARRLHLQSKHCMRAVPEALLWANSHLVFKSH